MEIGLVGLGKMGGNMRERLRRASHTVVGYDQAPGARDVGSLDEMVKALTPPRVVWVMVPAGTPTRSAVEELAQLLDPGDVVVDGGNSRWADDVQHASTLGGRGIGLVDCGVSGGIWGRDEGYALMCGGASEHVAAVQPAFDALKPAGAAGFVHAGSVGAGHFAKMVHNGIEYGIMQAYAEGYELLTATKLIDDVPEVFRSWRQGTVIRSWLLDLLVRALDADPDLDRLHGYAVDSGEGRWTVEAAIEHGVPVPAISAALFARFISQQEDSPAMKVVAALRQQFGGHAVERVEAAAGPDAAALRAPVTGAPNVTGPPSG